MSLSIPGADLVIRLHDRVIAETGGAEGLRSLEALEGAIGRVHARLDYVPESDIHDLSSLLGLSIVKAHAFADGNKRAAYGALNMMLCMHGFTIDCPPRETMEWIVRSAAGTASEAELAAWVRDRSIIDPVHVELFRYDRAGPEI